MCVQYMVFHIDNHKFDHIHYRIRIGHFQYCRCREMTLNECTETIQKLYQSKVIANEKAMRGIGELWLFFCLSIY